jgi:SHS2 domain-containing protein
MTDAMIEAYGDSLEEAFVNAAKAVNDTMVDLKTVTPEKEFRVSAHGGDLHGLLFDWLDKVMLLLVSDSVVTSEFDVKISRDGEYSLRAVARGEKLDLKRHQYKVEIKGVTYHQMEILQDSSGTTLRFLLDL